MGAEGSMRTRAGTRRDERMKVGQAVAEIMKREGIEILCGYPVNHLLEFAADADIRPVIVRQERIGLHMADAISRVTSGRKIGAFCMQHGPGTENAYGGVAQAYSESVPMLVIPQWVSAPDCEHRTELQRGAGNAQRVEVCRTGEHSSRAVEYNAASHEQHSERAERSGDRRNPDRYLERGNRRAGLHAGWYPQVWPRPG